MNRFYSLILLMLVVFYTGCAVTGSSMEIGIVFWGVLLSMAGIFLLFFLFTRPEEKK